MIDLLVYHLLAEDKDPALFELFLKNRKTLLAIAQKPKLDDDEFYKALEHIVAYSVQYGKLPPDKKALRDFIKNSPDLETTEAWTTTLVEALKSLNKEDMEVRLKQCTDYNVMITTVVNDARVQWMLFVATRFADVAKGGPAKKATQEFGKKKKTPSGPDDAKIYIMTELMKDVTAGTEVEAGLLHENAEKIALSLDNRLAEESVVGRMKTGFSHVDNSIIIGRQALRYIGIAGMSGDGKTTILNTMVYNFLRGGHNGLYLSFEHTPLEIWEFMAFLHASHEDYFGHNLPSLNEWDMAKDPESGIIVTDEDKALMGTILKDIQSQRNLPGRLDVQDASKISTFDGLVAHLETFAEQNEYDFAVIDYLARLDVGGDARFREKAIADMIHKGQFLTRTFQNGKGLVLVTPMQVNREANKSARKSAEKDEGNDKTSGGPISSTYYDINAIANFSEYQHDMDYIFSVFSDENMKQDYQMVMETLKVRKGKRPQAKIMQVNKKSAKVSIWTDAKRSSLSTPTTLSDEDENPLGGTASAEAVKSDLICNDPPPRVN